MPGAGARERFEVVFRDQERDCVARPSTTALPATRPGSRRADPQSGKDRCRARRPAAETGRSTARFSLRVPPRRDRSPYRRRMPGRDTARCHPAGRPDSARNHGVVHSCDALTRKRKSSGTTAAYSANVSAGNRCIERAVDTNRAEQGMLRVGSKPVPRQSALRRLAIVHQALPARKRPRGRPESNRLRQSGRRLSQSPRERRRGPHHHAHRDRQRGASDRLDSRRDP